MIDQEAPESWPNTSTVSTTSRTCPAPDQDNACGDCRACWDPAIKNPYWVDAMTTLINSKKSDVFRWHDSGDVQDPEHLLKIFEVCENTPDKKHWMPTR